MRSLNSYPPPQAEKAIGRQATRANRSFEYMGFILSVVVLRARRSNAARLTTISCEGQAETLLRAHPIFFGLNWFLRFAQILCCRVAIGIGAVRHWPIRGRFGRLANGGRAAQAMAIPQPHRHWPEAVAACIRTCETNAGRMQCDLYWKHGLPVGSSVVKASASTSSATDSKRLNAAGRKRAPTPCSP